MNRFYPSVSERANNRCEYCRAPEQVFNFAFEVEHIVPRSAGGDDDFDNLALSCESCNLYKASATSGRDPLTDDMGLLFNPRHDAWREHFVFDTATTELTGITSKGRATVERLKMNSRFQVRARRGWMTLELYP